MLLRPRRTLWTVNSADFCLMSREAKAGSLQPLYEFVRDALKPVDQGEAAWRRPVLLVDDLSVLLSLGVGAVAVLDFIHYCRACVCGRLQVRGPGRPRSVVSPLGSPCLPLLTGW